MDRLGQTHVGLEALINARLWLSSRAGTQGRLPPGGMTGQHLTRRHGQSTEFDQVRDYQHGDDARHIDWRASARAGSIQTRLFHRERDRPVFIAVEQSPAMFFASTGNFKSVQAALAASLFAWAADSVHDRVGGLVFGRDRMRLTLPARNRQGTLHLLHNVSQENRQLDSPFATDAPPPLQQALAGCQMQLEPGALLILVCSEHHLDNSSAKALGALAARHQSIWLPISDPLEHQLPEHSTLILAGPQQRLHVRPGQQSCHQHWRQQAQHTRQLWQQLASRHRALLLPVCTSSSLAHQLPILQEGLHVART